MLRHFILAISPLLFPAATEREYHVLPETYTLRLRPVPCDPRQVCGTPFTPRRVRVEILRHGKRIGYFEMPCTSVCEGDRLEQNVRRFTDGAKNQMQLRAVRTP